MILSRWKSGPLPKPVKILPTVPDWERIIEITQPDNWTPNAIFGVTRIFSSSKPAVVQRWLEIVVLPRVRDDIYENKKLNVHLYNSLKKSLYKPSAFFKGVVFALISSGTCTLREAHIVSSVMARVSIPVLHSAAGLKGLCDLAAQQASNGESAASTNIFIKTLLDKGLALPYQVIDALVFFFLRFRSVDPASVKEAEAMDRPSENKIGRQLPVLWHQCLLSFAQRYRNDINEDQREVSPVRDHALICLSNADTIPTGFAGFVAHTRSLGDRTRNQERIDCRPRERRAGRASRAGLRWGRHDAGGLRPGRRVLDSWHNGVSDSVLAKVQMSVWTEDSDIQANCEWNDDLMSLYYVISMELLMLAEQFVAVTSKYRTRETFEAQTGKCARTEWLLSDTTVTRSIGRSCCDGGATQITRSLPGVFGQDFHGVKILTF